MGSGTTDLHVLHVEIVKLGRVIVPPRVRQIDHQAHLRTCEVDLLSCVDEGMGKASMVVTMIYIMNCMGHVRPT